MGNRVYSVSILGLVTMTALGVHESREAQGVIVMLWVIGAFAALVLDA